MSLRRRLARSMLLLALAVHPGRGFRADGAPAVLNPDAGTTTRDICIGSVTGAAGTTASVPVSLSDGSSVASFQVDVSFNPSIVTPLQVRLGADTQAAGAWAVDSQIVGVGVLRVLGYSTLAVGLASGFRQIAIVDFLIGSAGAAGDNPLPLSGCVLGDPGALSLPCGFCVTPGIAAAEPRFALSLLDDALRFRPDRQVVEQGDWVVWMNVGTSQSHTTTSGGSCVPDGLWSGTLPLGGQFVRRFQEPPGPLPYFCQPHCPVGETGQVVVTPPIQLFASESSGLLMLTWIGGGGLYRVSRSDDPAFTGAGTGVFAPDAGDGGTTYTDSTRPGAGGALFYLVTNKN
jgi:plastocyanin